jgi:HEAT repeat protein
VALDALRAALRDAEPSVQASAAEALGASGRVELAPALEALLATPDVAPEVVLAALRGLAAMGALTVEAVTRALGAADPEIAKEAVAAAGRIPGEAGAALLREAVRSERWDVRHAVARALAARADRSLAEFARQQAATESDGLVARAFAAAAEALGRRS